MNFNSHTREGVTLGTMRCLASKDFNSHTREGVTILIAIVIDCITFQLTHP